MTYRERREARAARLRGWAEKRYEKAEAVSTWADQYRGDTAFNTQPGYIPERARLNAAQERSWESVNKAASMESRAGNIEAQLDRSIYSDDEDAIARLRERIAEREAERDRIKAYNASCRKGTPNESLLDDAQRADLALTRRVAPYQLRGSAFPAYATSNLNGNIARDRERLARLTGTYVQPGMVRCTACQHPKIIHGPKARPGCDECGRCAGFTA